MKSTRDSVRTLKKGLGGADPVTIAYKQKLLQAELDMLTKELLQVHQEIRIKERESKMARGKQDIREGLQEEIQVLEQVEKDLESEIDTLTRKAETQVVRELDLEDFNRDIERTEKLLDAVCREADILQIELERAPPRVKIVQPAAIEGP